MKYQQYLSEGIANEVLKISYISSFEKKKWPVLQVMSHLLLDGTILTEKKSTFKKRLLKNYNATLSASVTALGNKVCLTFLIENLNEEYIPNNESVKEEVREILLEVINNTKLLTKDVSKIKFNGIKEDLLNAKEIEKNSLTTLIEEISFSDYDYSKILEEVTIDDVRDMYMKIITTGRIVVQEITSDKESNLKDLLLKELYPSSEEKTDFYIPLIKHNNVYIEKKSHIDPTRVDFVLQRDNNKITGRDITLMQILANIFNSYMFEIIREENNISYNPAAYHNISNNTIILTANMPKEYKEITISLMKEIVNEIVNGGVDDEIIMQAITEESLDANLENAEVCNMVDINLEDEIMEIEELTPKEIENITVEEFREYAKDFKIKVVYYLGGK